MSVATISPQAIEDFLRAGRPFELIDVRTPAEFGELHLACARNQPLERLDPDQIMAARTGDPDEPLYVICRSGKRGEQACQKFLAAGFENIVNIEGGTLACAEAGLPVVRGKKAVSLERQVRIVAGLLALAGAVLAAILHPYWIGLSGFIGAGLIFAGVTDTCPMAMLIAKMPWNQAPAGPSGPASAACTTDSKSSGCCCG